MRSFFQKCLLSVIFLFATLIAIAALSQFLINHTGKNARYFSSIASDAFKKPIVIASGEINIFSFYPGIVIHNATYFSDNKKNILFHLDSAKVSINLLKSWKEKSWVFKKITANTVTINIEKNNQSNKAESKALIDWIKSQESIHVNDVEINSCNNNICEPLFSFSAQLTQQNNHQKLDVVAGQATQKITITSDVYWEEEKSNWKAILSAVNVKNQIANFSGNAVAHFDFHQHFSLSANGNGNIKDTNITQIQANYDKNTASFKVNGVATGGLIEKLFPGMFHFSVSGNTNTINLAVRNRNIIGTAIVSQKKNTPVKIKLQRLALQFNQKRNFSLDLNPKDIPALLISIDNFIINDDNLGHLFWRSSPTRNGLSLDKLKLESSFEKVTLKGSWIKEGAFEKTALNGVLTSNDFGEWFQKIHHIARIKKGTLDLTFSVEAQGPPQTIFSLNSLRGKSHFKIQNTSIVDKDKKNKSTGFLDSMLNLISLQSISNFLTLDFSALKKSHEFKIFVLKGNMAIEHGHLKTNHVVMKSAVAKIDFSGDIDLINNQNNLKMIVYPNIVQSQPLGACPVLFIFRFPIWVWKKISSHFLDPFFNLKYKVTGTLEKPVVKRI